MENLIVIKAFSWFCVIFGIIGIIGVMYRIHVKAQRELLDEMFKNGEITERVYKKHLN
jgi:hypothetical protein